MEKYQEQFQFTRKENGYLLTPLDPQNCDLLLRLFAGHREDMSEVIDMSLGELREHIADVAKQYYLVVAFSDDSIEPICTITDRAVAERIGAVVLDAALEERDMPLASVLWLRDGRIIRPDTKLGKEWKHHDWNPSLTDEENIQAAAEFLSNLYPDKETTYFNLRDFLEKQGDESPYQYGRSLYKYTGCGPWTSFNVPGEEGGGVYYEDKKAHQNEQEQDWWDRCTGISIGSIVEGSEVNIDPDPLYWPFTEEELDQNIKNVDEAATFYWERDNAHWYEVLDQDGKSLFSCQWIDGEESPKGTFEEGDDEAIALCTRAGEILMNGNDDDEGDEDENEEDDDANERMIPIPGTPYFVKEVVPDVTY